MHRLPYISRKAVINSAIAVVVALIGVQSLALAKSSPSLSPSIQKGEAVLYSIQKGEAVLYSKGSASRTDADGDGLTNRTEVKRTRTNPRNADSDGDGLSDGAEINGTRTNPRNADSDGDGANDGEEIRVGSNPWNPASSVPSSPANPRSTAASPPPLDTTPPNTIITSSPSTSTGSTSAKFTFSSNEPGSSFACRLDAGALGRCLSPTLYSGLSAGVHTFTVQAIDARGNRDPSPATRTWKVAAPPEQGDPIEAVWEAPETPLASVPVTLDGTSSTGEGPLSCTWSFENQTGSIVWQTQTGCRIEFTFTGSGTKHVELIVKDAEGDVDTNKQSFVVAPPPTDPEPDTSPPQTTIGAGPPATTTATDATLAFSSSEANSSFQCQLDGSAWAACSSPRTYSGLGGGGHSFSVRATDAAGNVDPTPATRQWTVDTTPPPVDDTTPPNTTIGSGPPATTTETSAAFTFSSNEPGSSFACKLDSAVFSPCSSPKSFSGLSIGSHTFTVRATDAAGNVDASPASRTWTVQAPPPPPPPPPPGDACVAGATNATSASAVTSAVSAGKDVCVTADVGNVNFTGMGNRSGVVVSTDGGSMGQLEIGGTTALTIRSARFRSVTIRGGHQTVIENSTIGGTPSNRVLDQLIFMPDTSNDVVIRNNDIGWTRADNSGNTGYGCRCYGTLNRLQFVGNKVHDIAADGFQGVGGSDVLIDRNEIGPVGANSDSSEHSDNIQITGNGSNLRITNNWIHHQGYFGGQVTGNAGSTYIHGGSSGSLLYENNLIQVARGRTEICGLGTGGTSRSNITIRRNTWVDGGQAFTGFPGFEWDCDSGSGNVVERNIAVDPDGGFASNGSAATFSANLWGQPSLVTLGVQGNCTSANCNPSGQEAIGYRKPSGVDW